MNETNRPKIAVGWAIMAIFAVSLVLLIAPPLGILLAIAGGASVLGIRRSDRRKIEAARAEHIRIWGW